MTVHGAAHFCGLTVMSLEKWHLLWVAVPALRPSPSPPGYFESRCPLLSAASALPRRLSALRAGAALRFRCAGRSPRGPLWLQTPGSRRLGSAVGPWAPLPPARGARDEPVPPVLAPREALPRCLEGKVRNGKAAIASGAGETLGRGQARCLAGRTPGDLRAATPLGEPPPQFSCLGPSGLCFEKVTSDSQLISVGKRFWPQTCSVLGFSAVCFLCRLPLPFSLSPAGFLGCHCLGC